MNKGYVNAINYYMKQHGITKEEANIEFEKMIGNINKIVNEECFKITNISRPILNQIIGFGHLLDVLYTADDVFNHRDGKFKDYIFTLS
ncbi:Alpha-barbatene synthase [Cardamine amara subsp. amara]|uniref:Alpha-barbatene synthase n=1 Tax=Cardamine amara subsp. amara TaxID=228776 RepID=A0ABD1C3J4_CARAN